MIHADTLLDNVPVDEHGIPKRTDTQLQAFYNDLRGAGVNVIDVTDRSWLRRKDAELARSVVHKIRTGRHVV